MTDNGREPTGVDVLRWVGEAETLGIGEILVTSVDMEGTRKGYDVDLVAQVRDRVNVPVIASGGAGSAAHMIEVARVADVDAVSAAWMLHYNLSSLGDTKQAIANAEIPVRLMRLRPEGSAA